MYIICYFPLTYLSLNTICLSYAALTLEQSNPLLDAADNGNATFGAAGPDASSEALRDSSPSPPARDMGSLAEADSE